jgi:hypothetical protein
MPRTPLQPLKIKEKLAVGSNWNKPGTWLCRHAGDLGNLSQALFSLDFRLDATKTGEVGLPDGRTAHTREQHSA